MNKILDAQDILAVARDFIECIGMAASRRVMPIEGGPIVAVAYAASSKIEEAIAILEEYRGGPDASPVQAAPSAKPGSPGAGLRGRTALPLNPAPRRKARANDNQTETQSINNRASPRTSQGRASGL